MSYHPTFNLFYGIQIPEDSPISDQIAEFFHDNPQFFTEENGYGCGYSNTITEDDVYDTWNDSGFIINNEFLDHVYIGTTIFSHDDDEGSMELNILEKFSKSPQLEPEILAFVKRYYPNLPVMVYGVIEYR